MPLAGSGPQAGFSAPFGWSLRFRPAATPPVMASFRLGLLQQAMPLRTCVTGITAKFYPALQ
jgi:hypothetical protein